MSEDAQFIEWSELVERAIEVRSSRELQFPDADARRRWDLSVIRSAALRKAFAEVDDMPLDEALSKMFAIIHCLETIRAAVPYADKPEQLVDPIERLKKDREVAVRHLWEANERLVPRGVWRPIDDPMDKYWAEFAGIAARISAEPFPQTVPQLLASDFNPKNYSRKGKSRARSAFNGWVIRELSRHVPETSAKRATAIAELLEFAGIDVTAQTVGTLLRRR